LVGTIIFSEKIVNFQTASTLQKLLVIASWGIFVFAIILSGTSIGVYYNSVLAATRCARKVPCTDGAYYFLLNLGNQCMLLAGIFFAVGLLSLVVSAVVAARPT
jgi:hypothetical protein